MESFKILNFVKKLTSLGERQFERESAAASLIISFLKQQKVAFAVERFRTQIPLFGKVSLRVDDKTVKAEPCSFMGGIITSKNNIHSSLISSQRFIDDPNINFNPRCPAVSRSNHYFAPALAVRRGDISRILSAKKIKGEVRVVPRRHLSLNIMAGNYRKPKVLFFAHYDSIGPGALDNASGVAVLLELITRAPKSLNDALYVFCGNEELSYDYPVYWGHGYRVFEKSHPALLQNAKAIYVVDCVGNGRPVIERDPKIAKLAFPINNLDKLGNKIFTVSGNIPKLMEVYHSSLDTSENLPEKYLRNTVDKLYEILIKIKRRIP